MRIRRSALNLQQTSQSWDPILLWYAKGVRELQSRAISDPGSWRYQAAMHEYNSATDPFRSSGQPLPSQADQNRFWNRCQHGSWFFLSWHRAYLRFFERMIVAAIIPLGGPVDWALPFWDYSAGPNARKLPLAFQLQTLPDGSPNPLLVPAPDRTPAANSNGLVGTPPDADTSVCLGKRQFTNLGVVQQFGGGQTGFMHNGGVAGACEVTPHGSMHGAVGGFVGWMSAFSTAALDPIFWFHHANIDRLWELWHRQSLSHTDPTQTLWQTGVVFEFHDENGAVVPITSDQVVDIAAPLMDYDYEGLPPKPAPPAPLISATPAGGPRGPWMPTPQIIPEMIGASLGTVTLGSEPRSVSVAIAPPTGPAALLSKDPGSRSVHLVLENVQAAAAPIETYQVFVNLPANADPLQNEDLRAGVLPRFGIVEASQANSEHGGTGVNLSYDITKIAATLETRKAWDPTRLQVDFVPVRTPGDREGELEIQPVRVGRVSVYYS